MNERRRKMEKRRKEVQTGVSGVFTTTPPPEKIEPGS